MTRPNTPNDPTDATVKTDGGYPGGQNQGVEVAGLVFTRKELLDLGVAWLALGVAFTFFLSGPRVIFSGPRTVLTTLGVSMATVGVGFLLHELAHKLVAVRFGQVAHFGADYGMLVVAVMAGLGGFLFAAPGAVYHRGSVTARENGLIALAGPVTNLLLLVVFLPLVFVPGLGVVGSLGVTINAVLAAFNLIPYGPLDGRTVRAWSTAVWLAVFVPSAGLTALVFLGGFGSALGI
jgi:Zn-dependent protease